MNPGTAKMVQILRLGSILFLWLNAYAYFSRFVDPVFLAGALVLSMGLAALLRLWGGRLIWQWVIFAGVLAGIRFLAQGIFSLLAQGGPSPADGLFLWFDRNYFPLLIPMGVSFALTTWALRFPGFIPWERLVNALLLALIFSFQAGYKGQVYPHPIWQGLAVALFLFVELWMLFLIFRPAVKARVQKANPWTRILFPILFLIPLVLGLAWFLLLKYEEAGTAGGGGLMRPELFRFDFSQFVKLESEISMNEDLVLLYREQGPRQKRYLRRYLLSGYSQEKGFFVDPPAQVQDETIPPVGQIRLKLPDPELPDHKPVVQEYYIVNFDPTSLVALGYPVEVVPFQKWDKSSFVGLYQVTSKVLTPAGLRNAAADPPPVLSPEVQAHYLNYGQDEKIRDLANTAAAGARTPWAQAMAVQNYLQTQYTYSLKPGVSDTGNQLHHFLFNSKKGYCSYFAFSMVLMLRSLGVPSRVAVGFFTQEEEELMNFYPVRANQAHAWVEVFLGPRGWVNFDPTSPNLAPGEEFHFSQGLPLDEFTKYITEILKNTLLEKNEPSPEDKSQENSWEKFVQASLGHLGMWWPWYLLGFWAGVLGLRAGIRWAGVNLGSPRGRVNRAWNQFEALGRRWGHKKPAGMTALDYAALWTGPAAEKALRQAQWVNGARYAADFSLVQAQQALKDHRDLQKFLGSQQPWVIRGLSLLWPWIPADLGRRRRKS